MRVSLLTAVAAAACCHADVGAAQDSAPEAQPPAVAAPEIAPVARDRAVPAAEMAPAPQASVAPAPETAPAPQVSVVTAPEVAPATQASVVTAPEVAPAPQASVVPAPEAAPATQASVVTAPEVAPATQASVAPAPEVALATQASVAPAPEVAPATQASVVTVPEVASATQASVVTAPEAAPAPQAAVAPALEVALATQASVVTAPEVAPAPQGPVVTGPDVAPTIQGPPDPRFASPALPVQTLQRALARTYQTSPTLMAQRAALRGLDSGVALARALGQPRITVGADFDQEAYTTRRLGSRGRNFSATTDAEQILFAGGRIRNSVRGADTRVIAGRADLRATEGAVFTEAVGAYADLLRDREIRDLNLNQVSVLASNLDATRARFRVRDVTRADVSQSEARLAGAEGDLAIAEGRLQASEENFERVIGARAGVLEPLPPLPGLPPTADQAVEAALANNGDVASFAARARAAAYDVAATKAERLPTISAVVSTTYANALGTADSAAGVPRGTLSNSATNVGAGLSLRLPLYQGGAASARVRVAEEARAQLMEQAIAAERLAVASARANFAIWRSALAAITKNQIAVQSNEVAVQSVKKEQTIGARSVIEVLNAEQELVSARIELAGTRRDAYVAAFALLNTMGAAEAADLNLEVGPLYDPRANYMTYARTWSDWADGPRHPAASTRIVPQQVNSPVTRLQTGGPVAPEAGPGTEN